MTRAEIAAKIADSIVDELKGNSPKAWMETFNLDDDDDEAVSGAMEDVAAWLEAGRSRAK